MATKDLDALREEAAKLRTEIMRQEDAATAEANKKLIGKTYKYSNSNSIGPRWWLYAKIVGTKGRSVEVFCFETDNRGETRVHPTHSYYGGMLGGYEPIPAKEFNRAWKNTQNKIASYAP